MKAVIQRVSRGSVKIEPDYFAQIQNGLVVLLGVTHNDTIKDSNYLAEKICNLRIFEDDSGKMNISVKEIGGEILSISQFTLYADSKKGNRPGFSEAAMPDIAIKLYDEFNESLKSILGVSNIKTGKFGANMEVEILNSGPVTIILESKDGKAAIQ